MQFDYTIEQQGQKYILKIAGVGQKQVNNLNEIHQEAVLYIEASLNIPAKEVKLNFVGKLDDRIISKHTPNRA